MRTENKIVRKVYEENVLGIVIGILLLTLYLISEASATEVWTWGYNEHGELGDGTTIDRLNPITVMQSDGTIFKDIIKIAGGEYNTIILRNDGTVWAWGNNYHGQVGDGTTINRLYPVKTILSDGTPFTNIKDISGGFVISIALKEDGTVWTWGLNDHGQLGDGTTNHRYYPDQVIKSDGTPLTNIIKVVGGEEVYYTTALKDDGTVWNWGYNGYGTLGDGTTIDRLYPVQVTFPDGNPLTNIIDIASEYGISIALKNDGTVWTWGSNTNGWLADGTMINRFNPVQVIKSDGTPLTNIIDIASGEHHAIVLKDDGTLWTWGMNSEGQLGDGTTIHRSNPVQVKLSYGTPLTGIVSIAGGRRHTIALKNDRTVWAWGHNNHGQLGDGTSMDRLYPVQVILADGTPLNNIKDISGGGFHTIAMRSNLYNFTGFFQPIDNLPTWNSVKAGSAIPVKFSLDGDQGIDIFAIDYPRSQKVDCISNAPIDAIEETVTAGSSSLSYNATMDQYSYIWKTDKAWKNSCRQLTILLKDGTYHNASFKLN